MTGRVATWIAAGLAVSAAGPASAQTTSSQTYMVVRAGATITVFKQAYVNPDCSSLGSASVSLVAAPAGGQVSVGNTRDYAAYSPTNPRSACNRRKLPVTVIVYRSRPDFTGTDQFSAEVVMPTGAARTYTFTIQVR